MPPLRVSSAGVKGTLSRRGVLSFEVMRIGFRRFGIGAAFLLAVVGPVAAQVKVVGGPTKVPGTSRLHDVACPAKGACVAVGESSQSSKRPQTGAVVAISGRAARVSRVAGTFGLVSVACPRAASCIGVGFGPKSPGVIVPIENGKPGRPHLVRATLQAIGCTRDFSCWITGFVPTRTTMKPVIVHVQGPKVGQVRLRSERTSVSFGAGEGATPPAPVCFSAMRCVGVGSSSQGRGPGTVYSLVNGLVEKVYNVPGTSALGGISCLRPGRCEAVGFTAGRRGGHGVVVRITNGKPGRARTVSGASYLGAVGCRTVSRCLAFGVSGSRPIVVSIRGGRPERPQAARSQVSGVGCRPSLCVGAGTKGRYPRQTGVVLRFF